MKCERMRELMSAYIDHEINEVDKVKFEKHLAQCPHCKEEFDLLADVVSQCGEIDEVELPENFREELHNKLIEAKANNYSSKGFTSIIRKHKWKAAVGAAAAVLIFAVSLNSLLPQMGTESNLAQMDAARSKSFATTEAPKEKSGIAVAPSATPEVMMAPDATAEKSMGATGGGTVQDNQVQAPSPALTNAVVETRKIIKNGNVSLKVSDVQTRIQEITDMVNKTGGYVESSYVDNVVQPEGDMPQPYPVDTAKSGAARETVTKVASVTIKIPAAQFESSFQTIIGMGKLMNQSTSSSDITKQYMDIESTLNNLKLQEKTFQDLLSKAKSVEDIIKIETELNRIRTQIDMYTGDLKRWDEMVDYSTIYINMTEVKEAELQKVDVPGVWQKANEGFVKTLNNIQYGIEWLLVTLFASIPYLLILGAGTLLAILWIRRNKK